MKSNNEEWRCKKMPIGANTQIIRKFYRVNLVLQSESSEEDNDPTTVFTEEVGSLEE